MLAGRRPLIGLLGGVLAASLACSACGQQSGLDLARQACVHVARSVRDFDASRQPGTAASTARRLRSAAAEELRAALPLAADATSDDGSLNALMTTISEGATIDEAHLIPALKNQCSVVNTNVNVNPQAPGSVNVNPQPPNTQNVNPRTPSSLPGS